jgi:hypothetical protein
VGLPCLLAWLSSKATGRMTSARTGCARRAAPHGGACRDPLTGRPGGDERQQSPNGGLFRLGTEAAAQRIDVDAEVLHRRVAALINRNAYRPVAIPHDRSPRSCRARRVLCHGSDHLPALDQVAACGANQSPPPASSKRGPLECPGRERRSREVAAGDGHWSRRYACPRTRPPK